MGNGSICLEDAAPHNSTFMGRKSWESNSRPQHGMEGPRDPGGNAGRVLTRGMGQREQVYGVDGQLRSQREERHRGSKPSRGMWTAPADRTRTGLSSVVWVGIAWRGGRGHHPALPAGSLLWHGLLGQRLSTLLHYMACSTRGILPFTKITVKGACRAPAREQASGMFEKNIPPTTASPGGDAIRTRIRWRWADLEKSLRRRSSDGPQPYRRASITASAAAFPVPGRELHDMAFFVSRDR